MQPFTLWILNHANEMHASSVYPERYCACLVYDSHTFIRGRVHFPNAQDRAVLARHFPQN